MKSEIQINDKAGSCRIEIEGTIGVPEEWQFDDPADRVATYERFRDAAIDNSGTVGQTAQAIWRDFCENSGH